MSLQQQPGRPTTLATPTASSSPCSWMPLEGAAHQWATFAATFLSRHAFTATSTVFSALSLEAEAVQHYNEACQSRDSGQTAFARDYYEQVVRELHKASAQWMQALYFLQRLLSDLRAPLEEQEYAALPRFFSLATDHLQRLGVLTQQVHAECVSCYQHHGLLGYEQKREREGAPS